MIVIVGATGHTGRPAAEALLAKGEKIRAVGRDAKKLEPLAQKGAEAFVGNVEDTASMTKAFEGATAVYLVLPEDISNQDLRAHQERVSDSFAAAVEKARVPYIVDLSSIGAQHAEKTGPIVGLHNQEQKLNRIVGLNVLHLRAAYFMENLLMSIPPMRTMGILPGGLTSDAPMPWIATKDIGAYAAAGLPKKTAALVIEMWKGANAGLVVPLEQRSAKNTTPTTLESFVTEVFAPAYSSLAAKA